MNARASMKIQYFSVEQERRKVTCKEKKENRTNQTYKQKTRKGKEREGNHGYARRIRFRILHGFM